MIYGKIYTVMAIMEIRKFNDPVLRKRAKKIWRISDEIRRMALDLAETMKEKDGVGLAAPQIGISKRMIAVESNFKTRESLVLINPKIIRKSRRKSSYTEGCLSFPDIFLEIKRSEKVTVSGKNLEGKKIEIEASGLLARALQHEIDHLNGILFFHRLGLIERIKFKFKNPSLKF